MTTTKYYYPFFLIAVVLLSGCIKIQPGYTNITRTDANGHVDYTNVDNSDWTEDKDWNTSEENLFQQASEPIDSTFTKTYVTVEPGYPNPCNTDTFRVRFASAGKCQLNYVVTDDKLKVILPMRTARLNLGYNTIKVPTQNFNKGDNYRMYYIFSGYKNFEFYKGHGDIAMAE
ncbi:MAG: hypothetical protein U0T84_13545 [Chitinophagales bacterium]